MVLRCGVGTPATYRPGVDLTIINNIGWFEDDRPDDVVYTTITRAPKVALAIPRTHTSSFEILVDLPVPSAPTRPGPTSPPAEADQLSPLPRSTANSTSRRTSFG